MYKVILIIGLIGSIITFISTIYLFFKCNVIEIVKDLTGIKIVKKKEVTLSPATDSDLTKTKTSISKSTSTLQQKVDNENKTKYKNIITEIESLYDKKTKTLDSKDSQVYSINDKNSILSKENRTLEDETEVLEEKTNILEEETGILEEETGILEEETGILGEELKDSEYVKEIDVVVINCTSIIDM